MKKKIFKILLLLITFSSILTLSKITTKAAYPLDYIHLYQITIDPKDDGTLDMHFKITWEVLDSNIDGPLEWIRIGIPNCYVDSLTAISSNIKKMKYSSSDGSFIEVYLNKKYYQGEILDIEFTSHQSRMYHLKENFVYYDYNPGWFEEIKVKNAIVKWKADNVIFANTTKVNNYYIWQSPLDYGETIKIEIKYSQFAFNNLDPNMQFTDQSMTKKEIILVIVIFSSVLIFCIVMIIVAIKTRDPYMSSRGFYGRGYTHYHYWWHPRRSGGVDKTGKSYVNPSSGGHGGFGGGGGCACACACAGGGRAGCSLKDFYNTNLKSEDIIKNLK